MRLRSLTAVLLSVALPVLCGIAVVYALIPLDPPDLGWGHVAAHLVPAGVLAGVVLLGSRLWPAPEFPLLRRLLVGCLVAAAAGQAAEATAGMLGDHDGTGHNVAMAFATVAVAAVVLTLAVTCVAVSVRRLSRLRVA